MGQIEPDYHGNGVNPWIQCKDPSNGTLNGTDG